MNHERGDLIRKCDICGFKEYDRCDYEIGTDFGGFGVDHTAIYGITGTTFTNIQPGSPLTWTSMEKAIKSMQKQYPMYIYSTGTC